MNFRPRVQKTIDYCAKWSVKVIPWEHGIEITDHGPSCVDINRHSRTLILRWDDNVWAQVGFLLHDLSHLICGEPVYNANECEGPMLALDWAHHKYLNFMKGHAVMMSEFAVGHYAKDICLDEWPYQSITIKRKLLNQSQVKAESLGLLNGWTPTFKPIVREEKRK